LTKDLVPIVFHDDFAAILEEKVGSCPSRDVEDRNHVTPVFFIKKNLISYKELQQTRLRTRIVVVWLH